MDAAHAFALDVTQVKDLAGFSDLLAELCGRLGCRWFALSHHVDFLAAPSRGVRIHNYPEEWALWFDQHRLGLSDPIHRASRRGLAGFFWHDYARFTQRRPDDEIILSEARRHGIGPGLTVPAHLPGEAHGSVSFAWAPDGNPQPQSLWFVRMIGGLAFEAARRLAHPEIAAPGPRLTDRQRECLIWAACGKSAWETATIMGLRYDTVKEHLRNARARYDVTGCTPLTIRALFAGDICFGDLAGL